MRSPLLHVHQPSHEVTHTPSLASLVSFIRCCGTLHNCHDTRLTTAPLAWLAIQKLNRLGAERNVKCKSSRCTARAHTRTLLQTRARDSSLFNVHPRGTLYHRSRTVCYTSLGREGNETQKKIIDTYKE